MDLVTKPGEPPLDLSKATKLKDLSFRYPASSVRRITMALQSVKSENLRRITIHPYDISANKIGDTERRQWQDLDHLLVQSWTSHSIRPTIVYEARRIMGDLGGITLNLLPELVGRGLIDLYDPGLKGKEFDH
jgi:hypothetical protein